MHKLALGSRVVMNKVNPMLQRGGPFGHAGHPESGGRRPRNWHGARKFSLLVPLLLGGWVPGADAFSKTAAAAASGCERGRCTAESVLCNLATYNTL